MTEKLKETKQLLINFIQETEKRKELSNSISSSTQNNENINYWTREECYIWIKAEPYYHLIKKNEEKPRIPQCFFEPASKFYDKWLSQTLDLLNTKNCLIKPPKSSQTLKEYLHDLSDQLSKSKKLSARWKFSLRSFCKFLREKVLDEEYGFLDILFPKKMDFFEGNIIVRKIPNEIYPLDIVDSSNILKQIASSVLEGRPNSQHSASEALALAWVCLVSAQKPTITELKLLETITENNLKKEKTPEEKITFGESNFYSDLETYYLHLPTLFYEEKTQISKMLYNYLSALCRLNKGKVFSHSLRSLRRTFNSIILKATLSANLNDISFLTFLSNPHEAIGHLSHLKK